MNILRLISRAPTRWVAGTLLAAVLVTLAGDLVTRNAYARVVRNTIDDVAVVSADGRHLDVTGPLEVTAGEQVELDVTVTQRSTGAVAKGSVVFTATGDQQQWAVRATIIGRAVFESGSAWAVGLAVTTEKGGNATDANEWLVNITLVEE